MERQEARDSMVGPITDENLFKEFLRNVKDPLIAVHKALKNEYNIGVIGPYQSGKTSLLLHCANSNIEGREGVYIDLQLAQNAEKLRRRLKDASLLTADPENPKALYLDEAGAIRDFPNLGEPAVQLLEQVAERSPIVLSSPVQLEQIHPRLKALVKDSVTMPTIPPEQRPRG